MASSVNTRFIAILASVLILLVGGAGAFFLLVVKKSSEELSARGDMLSRQAAARIDEAAGKDPAAQAEAFELAAFDLKEAATSYSKALHKDQTNITLLNKYTETLAKIPVSSRIKAEENLKKIRDFKQLATDIAPNDPEVLEGYYGYVLDEIGFAPADYISSQLLTATDKRLQTDPENPIARKYRGIATVLRLNEQMQLPEIEQAKTDLEFAAVQFPDDRLIPHYLANWHLYQARRTSITDPANPAAGIQVTDEAQTHLDRALELSAGNLEAHPDDTEVALNHVRVLLNPQIHRIDDARPVITSLEEKLQQNPEPMKAVIALADMMTAIDRDVIDAQSTLGKSTVGLQRTEDFLKFVTQARPNNIIYQTMLGNVHKLQMELDQALPAYQAADSVDVMGPSELVRQVADLQKAARYEIANIELIRAENEKDQAAREEKLELAERAVEELRSISGDTAPVLLLEGKVALLRGESTRAMQALDRAVKMYADTGGNNVEAVLLSARARQLEKQWGAAAEQLELVLREHGRNLQVSPSNEIRLRQQLVENYLNASRVAEATQQLDRLDQLVPDSKVNQTFRVLALMRGGDLDGALDLAAEKGLTDNATMVNNLARGLRAAGRVGEAESLLGGYLDNDPGNLAVLSQYTATTTDAEKRAARIAAAEAAGADGGAVQTLRLSGGDIKSTTPDEVVDRLAPDGDTADAKLRRAAVLERLGRADEARAAYEAALALDPDHEQVVLMGINYAIADENMELAEKLANTAAERNLDLAGGDFVRGQLAAARNDLVAAITFYKEGLKKRPVYDEGYRRLGDLHMRNGDAANAIASYETAIGQRPDNLQALRGLASANLNRERYESALDAIRRAVAFNEQDPELVRQYLAIERQYGDPQRIVELRSRIAERTPEDFGNRLELAMQQARMGRFDDARATAEAAQNAGAPRAAAVSALGAIEHLSGDTDAGVARFKAYVESLGDDATADDYISYANFLATVGRPSGALAAFREATRRGGDASMNAGRMLGDYLFDTGQFSEAARVYEDELGREGLTEEELQTVRLRLAESLLYDNRRADAEAVLADSGDQPAAQLLRSLIAQQAGDADAAFERIEALTKSHPDYARGFLQYASLLAARGENAEALAAANAALDKDPRLLSAHRIRGEVLLRDGRNDAAVDAFNALVEQRPNDASARAALADALLRTGRPGAASETLAAGLRQQPDNVMFLELDARAAIADNQRTQIVPKLERLVAASPTPEAVLLLAQQLLAREKFDDISTLLASHPEALNRSVELQAIRARALRDAGDLEAALNVFRRALSRVSDGRELAFLTSQSVNTFGIEAGAAVVRESVGAAQRPLVDVTVGQILQRRGDFSEARVLFDQVLAAIDPTADPDLAVQTLRAVAMNHYLQAEYTEAEDAFNRVLELEPNNVGVLNNLAFMLGSDVNRPAEGLPLAQQAAELEPNNASILDTLGLLQMQNGQVEAAIETLQAAIEIRPLPVAHYHLGRAYLDSGDVARAQVELDEAIIRAEAAGDEKTANRARDLLGTL